MKCFTKSIVSMAAVASPALAGSAALAQETKVAMGISGWTGFAP